MASGQIAVIASGSPRSPSQQTMHHVADAAVTQLSQHPHPLRRERWTAAWFGPKGFAPVVYGLLVLEAQIPQGDRVFDLVAVTIALSIILHSSSDVPIARLFHVERLAGVEGAESGSSPRP